jgi:hypothetical protein
MPKNRLYKVFGFVTFLIFLFFVSCPQETNPPSVIPAGIKLKPHGDDTLRTESGIQAEVDGDKIRIEWSPIYGGDNIISEYKIFRSVGLDTAFKLIGNIVVQSNFSDSSFIDPPPNHLLLDTVVVGTTYYYYVIAVDTHGSESDTSEYFKPANKSQFIQSFRLGEKVENLNRPTLSDTSVTGKPVFDWCLNSTGIPIRYLIRVGVQSATIRTIWIAEVSSRYADGNCQFSTAAERDHLTFHNFSYTPNVPAAGDSLLALTDVTVIRDFDASYINGGRLKKGNYYWRVDCDYGQNNKSKSGWEPFLVSKD